MAWVAQQKDKLVAAEKKRVNREIKERKEKIKTRSDWIKVAQKAFNDYIRERDKDDGCISCGAPLSKYDLLGAIGGSFDCGHYRSVGSARHLRFDERNAHGQCKKCNRYGAGRVTDYRIGLIKKIGLLAVEALESDNKEKKYTIEDLKEIKKTYQLKLKELRGKK